MTACVLIKVVSHKLLTKYPLLRVESDTLMTACLLARVMSHISCQEICALHSTDCLSSHVSGESHTTDYMSPRESGESHISSRDL